MDISNEIWAKNLKFAIELVYLVSGPLLAFLAFKALEQISVAKRATKVNSIREAYRLSAERCEFFQDKVIPALRTFEDACKINNIEFFSKSKVSIEKDAIHVVPHDPENELKKLQPLINELSDLVNYLEIFAIYFTSKIADEQLAYRTLGSIYCKTVKELMPFLAPLSKNAQVTHIFQLFFMWHARQEVEEAEKTREALLKQLKEVEKKGIEVPTGKSIGTE